jgi:hypothetical protein
MTVKYALRPEHGERRRQTVAADGRSFFLAGEAAAAADKQPSEDL